MFKSRLLLTASLIASLSFAPSLHAQDASAPAAKAEATSPAVKDTTPVTRAEFKDLLRQALIENPEVMLDAMKVLREKRDADMKKKMETALAKNRDALFKDTKSPVVGPSDADIVIAEFFDYHCGYCKHFVPAVAKILGDDKKVRFVMKEFPILKEDSVTAARAALAVYNIDKSKYFDFHQALFKSTGKFDEKALTDIAKKVGIDDKKLMKEMENPDITKELDDNRMVAEELGIGGTPAIVVGNIVIPGAIPHDDLVKVIDNIRKGVNPETDVGFFNPGGVKKKDEKKADDKKAEEKKPEAAKAEEKK